MTFSIQHHARFLDGYLDAVFRCVDTVQGLGCMHVPASPEIAPADTREWVLVENWAREFDAFVGDVLGLDPRSRMTFYLVEYLCWFQQFTTHAMCHRERWGAGESTRVTYRLQWPNGERVFVTADLVPQAGAGAPES